MEPKILFVKQFLATLCEKKVTTIPINNKKFKDGIQSMADYYHSNAGSFGPYADALDMLFLKYSTRGDFSQFSKIIEGFNGRIVSLENPHYIKANLKLEKDYIEASCRSRSFVFQFTGPGETVCFLWDSL